MEQFIEAETVTITGESVVVVADSDALNAINQNICDGFALVAALIGLIFGWMVIKELLSIWRH